MTEYFENLGVDYLSTGNPTPSMLIQPYPRIKHVHDAYVLNKHYLQWLCGAYNLYDLNVTQHLILWWIRTGICDEAFNKLNYSWYIYLIHFIHITSMFYSKTTGIDRKTMKKNMLAFDDKDDKEQLNNCIFIVFGIYI